MNANIFDFVPRATHPVRALPPRLSLTDALARIERCCTWLKGSELSVLGFTGTTLHEPLVVVSARPEVWQLFSGRAERTGYKQEGALRYEVWEGFDRINHVRVRWQEVAACA